MNQNLSEQFGGRPYKLGRTTPRPEGHFSSDKPGTQGQMVTGGHAHPWPRGFTPERQQEVNKAMSKVVYGGPNPDRYFTPDASTKEAGEGLGRARKGARNILVDAVARSAVPTNAVEDLKWDISTPNTGTRLPRNVHGQYDERGNNGYPTITLAGNPITGMPLQRNSAEHTLVHEIGHHISKREATPHSSYDDPIKQGAEEAFADNYARKNWRGRGTKNNEPPLSGYELGAVAYSTDKTDSESRSFSESYFTESYNYQLENEKETPGVRSSPQWRQQRLI